MNKAFLLIVTVVCATVICKTFLTLLNLVDINHTSPIPLAARSKAWALSRSPAEITNLNPGGDVDISLLWILFVIRLGSPGVYSAKERRSEGSNLDSQNIFTYGSNGQWSILGFLLHGNGMHYFHRD